jgi:hypothetical protein
MSTVMSRRQSPCSTSWLGAVGPKYAPRGRMPILCEGIESNVADIVAEWKRLTDKPPWSSLSDADWVDHLPPLLRAMIAGVVCGRGSHVARQEVVDKAIIHGEHRRARGLTVEIILEEQSQLRTATWHFLTAKVDAVATSGVVEEILRLDAAIGVATLASIRGFHRPEIERTRDWQQVISELLRDWERITLTEPPPGPSLAPSA